MGYLIVSTPSKYVIIVVHQSDRINDDHMSKSASPVDARAARQPALDV